MFLFYLLPILPYLLFKLKDLSIINKLMFITFIQIGILFSMWLSASALKSGTILFGAYMISVPLEILIVLNVIIIVILAINKKLNTRTREDGI